MKSENLVIVRAGDRSLHPQWLGEPRNWDIAVSYFGDHKARYAGQFDFWHEFKGSKWEGITDFLMNFEGLNRYKYIWLPDDDIFCNCNVINEFFLACQAFDFTIAQPALTPYSEFTWRMTLQDQSCVARQTSFVEIMAPCFKQEHLHLFSRFFGENSSGWGLEWLWSAIAFGEDLYNIGIVDSTPVYHTRAVGSAGHGGGASCPKQEMDTLLRKYGVKRIPECVLKWHQIGPAEATS